MSESLSYHEDRQLSTLGIKIASWSCQMLSRNFQGLHLFITTIIEVSHHLLSGSSGSSKLYFGCPMGHQSVTRGSHLGHQMTFTTSSLRIIVCPCHHLVIFVIIVGTRHWRLVYKTLPQEDLHVKSTHDFRAVFDIEVGLSLRLIYLFDSSFLHHNSRLTIIMSKSKLL